MKLRHRSIKQAPTAAAKGLDDRFQAATPLRALLNKVFPDHWSFLIGEIALFSFVVLLLSGVFLTLFFDPSMRETTYDGAYTALRGVEMSAAYESSLRLSFEVRGGLFMRQLHHWAALLFLAAIILHMLRVFFTGAFRKPRETNWIIGLLLFWIAFLAGFSGYSMVDDGLSGTGLRVAQAIVVCIPVIGSWLSSSLFGGEFPGELIIGRLYIVHVLLLPGALLALISLHLGLVFKQKHTQWPGPLRTNDNVVGERMFPRYVMKQGGFFFAVFGVLALMAGLFQINPVWLFGPYRSAEVSAASQPDWYVMFLDGAIRLMPAWQITLPIGDGYSIPPIFWPAVVLPGVLAIAPMLYPFLEARYRKDYAVHNLLERPRDNPARTGLGVMAVSFYLICTISGANDVLADKFHISLNAMTWAGRIGLVLIPPLGYWVAHRLCLGLQQHDRQVLAHGVETGIIRRLPDGGFVEIHQPLAATDDNGRLEAPQYAGWVVPKKMNRIGALAPAIKGFFFPVEQPAWPRPAVPAMRGEDRSSEADISRDRVTGGEGQRPAEPTPARASR